MTKIINWFTGLDTQMKIVMFFVFLGLVGIGIATAFHVVDTLTETATETGAMKERVETQGKVIENVRQANEARAEISDPRSCASYVECMQSARSTANCVRYLPDHEGCAVQSGASPRR